MFPEPTELLLIGCSIESNWTPKSKSNALTPRTNSQTYWPRETSHVMNGIIFCVCLTLPILSSTNCSEVMSKRTQKDAGEERVTAKSKPMMNLVSRCSERNPDVLASTASESRGKTRYESQIPLSSWTRGRTGRLVNEQPPGLFTQHTDRFIVDDDDMDFNTVTESDLSLKSISFLHRVNDRVRKMLDQSSKDATHDSNTHSLIWWMFLSSTMEASVFMVKELPRKFTFHQKCRKSFHNETDVRHFWEVDNRTIRWDLWIAYN